jgi:hypothetical protein
MLATLLCPSLALIVFTFLASPPFALPNDSRTHRSENYPGVVGWVAGEHQYTPPWSDPYMYMAVGQRERRLALERTVRPDVPPPDITLELRPDTRVLAPGPARVWHGPWLYRADTVGMEAGGKGIVPVSDNAAQETEPADRGRDDTDPPVSERRFGSEIVLSTAYVWRGFLNSDTTCVQPGAWVTFGGVTFSSWLNVESRAASRLSLVEHDFAVEYARDAGEFSLSVGWVNYFFPAEETDRHTNELFATIAHAGPLSPDFAVYVDPHAGSGIYAAASVGHSLALRDDSVRAAARAGVGYNHRLWIDGSGFADVNIRLGLELPLFGEARLEPFLTYSRGLRPETRSHYLYGGVSMRTR